MDLSPDAKQLWVEHYNAHAQEQVELSGDMAAAWSKLEGYAARLALVVYCVRQVWGEPVGDAIDAASIQAGVTLAKWFGNEAKRTYAMLHESDEEAINRRLVDWIQGKGGSVTARDLTRGPRQFRGSVEAAEKTLDKLVEAGLGRWEQPTQTGRGHPSSKRFIFTPAPQTSGDTTPVSPPATLATVTQLPFTSR